MADAEHVDAHVRAALIVFGALLVLTGVTVAAWKWLHLSTPMTITVALLIATVKGSLVAAWFMHLIDEKKLIYSTLVVTVAFFFVLLLTPFITAGDPVAGTETPLPAHVESEGHHGDDHGDEHAEDTADDEAGH